MGLCKCPKRRVTNQFCFEHRVCVCENCMVTNHPICVVQSYLQWLQDSDYNSICELCLKDLSVEDNIRLTCYHVFHWSCLDQYSRQLPLTTAPRGYTCPACKTPLFPASNLISPVADALKEKLAGVNWARAGLGLPLLSEEREILSIKNQVNLISQTPKSTTNSLHSVVNVDENGAFNRLDAYGVSSNRKKNHDDRFGNVTSVDHDDDKYKRRPVLELISTWWKITFGAPLRSRGGRSKYRKYCMIVSLVILGIILLLLLVSRLGTYSTDNDPSLDAAHNPFIGNAEK